MNGLELSRAFYETHGRPMLESEFPDLAPLAAVGLFGSGSECLGYDDGVSEDHDFEPGFCILLPEEAVVDRRQAFLLERAYAKLPRDFMGHHRPVLQPVGGARRGVLRTADFFTKTVGAPNGVLDTRAWLMIPEQALLEVVRKKPQVPNTARQAASLPGHISRGKRSSMPQPKTRPDSPVPSLQGPCDRSLKSEVPCGSCLNWR